MINIISIITELVSSLPYNNYSINERQKIYDKWLEKYKKYINMDTLKQLSILNKMRDDEKFHHFHIWESVDWSNAIAGEVGELCNLVKKQKRLNIESDYQITNEDIADEAADIVIYLEILCQNKGIDLSEAIKSKFNKTSYKYGIPHIKFS